MAALPDPDLETIVALLTHKFAELESQSLQENGLSELSMKQIVYLDAIQRLERPTFSELAAHLGVSKPSVTAIVAKLIARDYAARLPSQEDRRVSHIVLSEQGRRLSEAHQGFHRKIARQFAAALDPEEQRQLGRLLAKVARAGQP